jgi:hypothetical protein
MARAPTRGVNGLAPVVERALDAVDAREALGPARSTGSEPRGERVRTGWEAARHASDRVDG